MTQLGIAIPNTGYGMSSSLVHVTPLAHLIEQLWAPALSSGARLRVDPGPDEDWTVVESYRLVPDERHARLLIPDGPAGATAGSLRNYRGLRRPQENAIRTILAAGASAGAMAVLPRVTLEAPRPSGGPTVPDLPLPTLASALGADRVHASIGVRTGANRKATLQLVDDDGGPVGYAKFGWNRVTGEFVRAEAEALAEVGGRPAAMRAPRLLAALEYHGRPVIVTEPLPLDVRGCHRLHGRPSAQEIYALCPIRRVARPASSQHFVGLRERLSDIARDPATAAVGGSALNLAQRLASHTAAVPVSARWHGDLTSWNCARDRQGQLWSWDWESSEVDAVAGLDAVHWELSERRRSRGGLGERPLTEAVGTAGPLLLAAGLSRRHHALVAATYALTVVERAANLARREGGWSRVWVGPGALTHLVGEAEALLARMD